jgi:hypothetical protein
MPDERTVIQLRLERARSEQLRWNILLALDVARPERLAPVVLVGALATSLSHLNRMQAEREVLREVDYLRLCGLLTVGSELTVESPLSLTADGIDVVQYTADCRDTIGRPKRT